MKNNLDIAAEIIEIIKNEPEYPGDPPEELMNALMSGDRDLIIQALRLSVHLTKFNILNNIKNINLEE